MHAATPLHTQRNLSEWAACNSCLFFYQKVLPTFLSFLNTEPIMNLQKSLRTAAWSWAAAIRMLPWSAHVTATSQQVGHTALQGQCSRCLFLFSVEEFLTPLERGTDSCRWQPLLYFVGCPLPWTWLLWPGDWTQTILSVRQHRTDALCVSCSPARFRHSRHHWIHRTWLPGGRGAASLLPVQLLSSHCAEWLFQIAVPLLFSILLFLHCSYKSSVTTHLLISIWAHRDIYLHCNTL